MNIEELRDYCLSLPKVSEEFPFGPDILVFKIMGKIFCLMNNLAYDYINVKCDPETAVSLREEYAEVQPGYHMNKKHWNSIGLQGSISDNLVREWIYDSYLLVIAGLPKKQQAGI